MNNVEYEIDLKDLLYRIMKRWRRIIVGAIIIALVAGMFKFVTGMLELTDSEKLAAAESKYAIALADYEATGEKLRTTIQNLQDDSANQQEYNDKSALMKIDPMNKWVGSFVLYIDSKYQIDPSLTYQNTDRTNRLLIAYSGYLKSGEFYNELLSKTDIVDEIRFLNEIYWVTVDSGASSVTVNSIGKSESDVREILDLVKEALAEKSATFKTAIGDHSYDILMESVYSTIDLDLDETQKKNLLAVSEYANQIGEADTKLTEWEETPAPRAEYGMLYTVKQAVKFVLFGGVAGIFVMAMLYAMIYVLNGRVKTESDWAMMGYRVLARVGSEEKKRAFWKIDRWVDRVIGGRPEAVSLETSCKLAANNLSGVLKEKGVSSATVISDLDETTAAGIVAGLDKAGTGIPFTYAGNVLSDPETVKRLSNVSEVLLLGHQNGTRMEDVQKIKTLLEAWGKTTLGVIVLE